MASGRVIQERVSTFIESAEHVNTVLLNIVNKIAGIDWDKIIVRGVMGDAYWRRMEKKARARRRYQRMMERRGLLKHKGDKP